MARPKLTEGASLDDIANILPKMTMAEQQQLLAELEKLEKLQKKKSAQERFIKFTEAVWPTFIAGRHHYRIAEAFERVARGECKRLIVNLAPRHCLEVNTPILTIRGWTTMGKVQPGNYVYGPDGQPTLVVGKSDVHKSVPLYKVTTNDGASVVTDGGHRWRTVKSGKHGIREEYTTEELWKRQKARAGREARNPRIPDTAAVGLSAADLPLDPYVLGLWLGDGSKYDSTFTCHPDDAKIIRPEIERRGYITRDRKHPYTFGVKGIKVILRKLGVLKNKHIPASYLLGSIEQRADLMRGLMDSDGNVSKAGQSFFSQKSLAFIEQVRELLWSLGVRNTLQVSEAKIYGKSYGDTYKLSFYAEDLVFLPRKRVRARGTVCGRFIRVEKLDRLGDVQCIEVDREDHLFLAGKGLVCTLNTKSQFCSWLLPAWYLGKYPHKKIIQCSNTAELAVGFGRQVRNLVDSNEYADIFEGVALSSDSKAAGRWNTNKPGGEYFAIGVGGTVTGRGADLLIIDDPFSEQEAALAESNPEVYDKVYEWYTSGPRQRLQPGGSIVILQTRWSKRDLTGRIIQDAIANNALDEWEIIELPAIMPSGQPLWPEFWSLQELENVKRDIPHSKWMAQYMQDPVSEGAAIIKREWWKVWDEPDPPRCEFIMQSWDTAFEKNQRADYSACTTWGVFYKDSQDDGTSQANIILLNAFKDKLEFPELKKKAIQEYKYWQPDSVIIEKKASGAPIIYELRSMGIPVQEFTPVRGNDKISRLNSVADIFASGRVWMPPTRWAEEVRDEVAEFPASRNDDLTDSTSMAMHRFRQGGYITTEADEPPEEVFFRRRKKVGYY